MSKRKKERNCRGGVLVVERIEGGEKVLMSKKYPECPLYDHLNCKKIDKPDVCAIVRKDKQCLKKRKNPGSKK
jgi:hypothetical protein